LDGEIIFLPTKSTEGGYIEKALFAAIVKDADTLKALVQWHCIHCHLGQKNTTKV
jgi:hypothetical protein